jgi:hypothetical protein
MLEIQTLRSKNFGLAALALIHDGDPAEPAAHRRAAASWNLPRQRRFCLPLDPTPRSSRLFEKLPLDQEPERHHCP